VSLRDAGIRLTTLDGRYRITEPIAAGGMGEVYRALDAVLAREVAIKVLHPGLARDPGFVQRFRREARAAAVLSHPNIAAVHDWGAVDGIYYMVMEFIRGESLRELLHANHRLEPVQAADALGQILAALDHAHRRGIVHRDIKPENALVTPDGVVKVADFGLARAYADGTATRAGTVAGTVQYVAPELLRGEPADPRTDLYSVGILAFELLTGRLPFTGETPIAIARKHLSQRVPPPSSLVRDLPRGLDGFVQSATERDRELRPESAAEMRRDLAREAGALPASRPLGELVRQRAIVVPEAAPERADTVAIDRAIDRQHRREARPRWRRAAKVLGAAGLVAALAWALWTYAIPHRVRVPDVRGEPLPRAQARLVEDGLRVVVASGVYSLELERGEVVRSAPDAGTELEGGDAVRLVPSLGPRPVATPNVRGMTAARARVELVAAGLKLGRATSRYDLDVAEGRILSQRPPPGREVPETSAVAVVISKGPPPVPVPSVIGETLEAATADVHGAGLAVSIEERYSTRVDFGVVLGQDPAPEARIAQGSTVTIVVSQGPRHVEVPALKGLPKAEAVAALAELGLRSQSVVLPNAERRRVVTQDPRAGTRVRAGSRVVLYLA
jgi:eukaryotic-like serine/threonine-protein kinase